MKLPDLHVAGVVARDKLFLQSTVEVIKRFILKLTGPEVCNIYLKFWQIYELIEL